MKVSPFSVTWRPDIADQINSPDFSDKTVTGPLRIDSDADAALTLRDPANSGNAAVSYIEFRQADNARTGYVGAASASNQDLHVVAERGSLNLLGTTGTIIGPSIAVNNPSLAGTSSSLDVANLSLKPAAGTNARIRWDRSLSGAGFAIRDDTAAADRLLIDTAGRVSLSAGQLGFPATQNPSSDPNTLDDYEEGSWTPVYGASSGALGAITYGSRRYGRYVKIGSWVSVVACITTDAFAVGTGATSLYVGGLPFVNSTPDYAPVHIGYSANFAAGGAPWSGLIGPGATTVALYTRAALGGGSTNVAPSAAMNTATGNFIIFGATYPTSS
ncbi:hypothetical protein SAZ10_00470 [Mesorhizobium sp. BAC0120]|uniref:hypothetical protein n=1 Tax=Mesorhizobium sp. BAC0120 TaxID=3090670 RepID=UPI00298C7CB8|nr:hypothetical protein [Mesorhizobium sp. BAC0120]MDW6020229.1 hypothetical protein [Mesorhizobium sp. BAC0120]